MHSKFPVHYIQKGYTCLYTKVFEIPNIPIASCRKQRSRVGRSSCWNVHIYCRVISDFISYEIFRLWSACRIVLQRLFSCLYVICDIVTYATSQMYPNSTQIAPKNTLQFDDSHQWMESWHFTYTCKLSNRSVFLCRWKLKISNWRSKFLIHHSIRVWAHAVCICILGYGIHTHFFELSLLQCIVVFWRFQKKLFSHWLNYNSCFYAAPLTWKIKNNNKELYKKCVCKEHKKRVHEFVHNKLKIYI